LNEAYSEYKHSLTFRIQRYVVTAICAPIANLPNTAQLEGTPYHSPPIASYDEVWRAK